MPTEITPREFDTILAALRLWQADVTDNMAEAGIPVDFAPIAMDHGDALSSSEIDQLIAKLFDGEFHV